LSNGTIKTIEESSIENVVESWKNLFLNS